MLYFRTRILQWRIGNLSFFQYFLYILLLIWQKKQFAKFEKHNPIRIFIE